MKIEIQVEVERSIRKIKNLRQRSLEIETKLRKLQEEQEKILKSLREEEGRIASIGLSLERPESNWTPERRAKSEQYNQVLQEEKKEILHSQNLDSSSIFASAIRKMSTGN